MNKNKFLNAYDSLHEVNTPTTLRSNMKSEWSIVSPNFRSSNHVSRFSSNNRKLKQEMRKYVCEDIDAFKKHYIQTLKGR